MGEVVVFRATYAEIWNRWDVVRPWLEEVTKYGHGEMNTEDMLEWLELGKYQCWIVADVKDWVAVALTEVVEYPRMCTLKVIALGGKGLKNWRVQLNAKLQEFAKDQGCTRIDSAARPGFARMLRRAGVKPLYLVIGQEVK